MKYTIFILFLVLTRGIYLAHGDLSTTYYYDVSVSADHHVVENGVLGLKKETSDTRSFSTGNTTHIIRESGYGNSIPPNWQGASSSQVYLDMNSETAVLKSKLEAHASASHGGNPSAYASVNMGVRQYYRAEGNAPINLRLSFHYDGVWNDGGSDNNASVALGTYLTRVKNENTFFSGGEEAERPLDIMLFTDFPEGPNFYDAYFGKGQEVADTLAYNIFFSNRDKYTPSGSLDENYSVDVTVQPGELILLDTMFHARVGVRRETDGITESVVDFSNTAYSSVEILNGEGSLVPLGMPVSIPEPSSLILLVIGVLFLRFIRR